jgi:peptidoglycan hydrolase CwlO-like protein
LTTKTQKQKDKQKKVTKNESKERLKMKTDIDRCWERFVDKKEKRKKDSSAYTHTPTRSYLELLVEKSSHSIALSKPPS